ncbi:MAG: GrpB family protein [Rhodothermales bacterium]
MLGLKKGILKLVPFSEEWLELYQVEKKTVRKSLGQLVDDIQHVGSTSLAVEGMIAKPILDIAVRVGDLSSVELSIPKMEAIGYTYRGEQGIAGRHLFAKGDPVTIHLHMMLPGCSNWENQLYFRDYLLEHPEKAKAYAALKKRLFLQHDNDRRAYMDAKGAFIQQMLSEARKVYEQ